MKFLERQSSSSSEYRGKLSEITLRVNTFSAAFSLWGLFDSVGREEVEGTSVFHVQRSVERFSAQINVRFSLLTYVGSVRTCYGSVATAETSVCLFYFRLKFWLGFSVHNSIPTTPAFTRGWFEASKCEFWISDYYRFAARSETQKTNFNFGWIYQGLQISFWSNEKKRFKSRFTCQ